jgi:hypothetical protein
MGFSDTDLFCRFAVCWFKGIQLRKYKDPVDIVPTVGNLAFLEKTSNGKSTLANKSHGSGSGASSSLWIDFASDNDAGGQCGPRE